MLSLLFSLATGCTESRAADPAARCPKCNIVWITIDTTRADRMGYLGNTQGLTPNIDALARRGTAWRYAYSQGAETLGSVSSFFTGRYRNQAGIDFFLDEESRYHAMPDEVTTVAEALKANGWSTRAYIANYLVTDTDNRTFNLLQGFDNTQLMEDARVTVQGTNRVAKLADPQAPPTFLYLHYFGPHTDNPRAEGFESRRGHFQSTIGDVSSQLYVDVWAGKRTLVGDDLDYIRAMYDDAVWQADAEVGKVLAAIQASPAKDRTIVVVTADHGETLGEPGYGNKVRLGHSQKLSEELVHVPLVIAGPGVPKGVLDETRITELVDLAPTLANLVGVKVDPSWQWVGQDAFAPTTRTAALSHRGRWAEREVGARSPTASLLHEVVTGRERAYDLKTDPHEISPIAPTSAHAALAARIKADLATPGLDAGKPAASPALTDEERERLKALGYLE